MFFDLPRQENRAAPSTSKALGFSRPRPHVQNGNLVVAGWADIIWTGH